MDLNITLKLDEDLIEKLKAYAQEKNMSISLLLESYAKQIAEWPDYMRYLSSKMELPLDFDAREVYRYLLNKQYTASDD
ncbi:DUF6364 family protein [Penaeicola halotolerans]|uniref:DUF6364 family protein n=1 Tax=Penaeicola halotolerans TaxID=2793196 RepID=UPI001CF8221C|nr:DUF6364 family protein [Penaeicola halotolerans]